MIYQIKDKYYINVAPHIFKEVVLKIENNDLVLVPTENKIEVYKMHEVKQIYFQNEKESLLRKFLLKRDKVESKSKRTKTSRSKQYK